MDGLNEVTGDLLVLGIYSLFYIIASVLLHTVLGSVHVQAEDGRGLTTIDKLPPEMLLQVFSHLPYSDILSVRCTNKSWQKISQDEGLLKSVATRDFTWAQELIQYLPPYLEMTAKDNRIYYSDDDLTTLGLFKLCPDTSHERKAVYKQMNLEGTLDALYIFCKNSTWKVSDIMGSSNAYFWNTTASPTTSAWDDGSGHVTTVRVRALAKLPPACAITLSCPRVTEDMTCPEVMGDYVATSQYSLGRLIFKHVMQKPMYQQSKGPSIS